MGFKFLLKHIIREGMDTHTADDSKLVLLFKNQFGIKYTSRIWGKKSLHTLTQ